MMRLHLTIGTEALIGPGLDDAELDPSWLDEDWAPVVPDPFESTIQSTAEFREPAHIFNNCTPLVWS